ncbi:hypothetical protein [Chryseobacterium sp. Leaf394]|uniref:hypothetical protein n=1 Tax=Chryseobacterium sp. Leaf394 TaxID=1736361 RepID=UPI0006F1FA3E|nr:hypothetical protein [Chryseobacterium sp. Leaf394]KQS92248.1 hypothetical protein ASG21_07340 [Chryseobacterium sp. Leaf394]
MKINISLLLTILLLTACNSKTEEKKSQTSDQKESVADTLNTSSKPLTDQQKKNVVDFIPAGYALYKEEGMEDIKGHLNKDGLQDVVLVIKGTNPAKFVDDEYRGRLDRNRRGIIVLLNKGSHYEVASKNYNCFSSENEDGGVYYAPELGLSIEKGNLIVSYGHGRYGHWSYTFRSQDGDLALIGYDASYNRGPVPQTETSINFLTRKKLTRDNLNKDDDGESYVENFEDSWETVEVSTLLKLSEIKDFDELRF